MCGRRNEIALHHQQCVNGLLRAGRAQRVAGKRFGGRNGRTVFAAGPKNLAQRLNLLNVANGRGGGVRVDVIDRAIKVFHRHLHAAHRAFA